LDGETPVGSPSASILGKRVARHLDEDHDGDQEEEEDEDEDEWRRREEEDEDEEEEWRRREEVDEDEEAEWRRREEEAQRARNSRTGLKIRLPAARAVGGGGGGGGHGGGGAGGVNPIHLWTPDCARRGDAALTGSDADIGNMPCNQPGCGACEGGGWEQQEEQEEGGGDAGKTGRRASGHGLRARGKNNAQDQRKRARKEKVQFRLDPDGGPAITEGAGQLLSKLLAVFGRAHRQDLEEVLAGVQEGCALSSSHDMVSVVARIKQKTNEIRVQELHLMLSLIQLALNVDSLKADAKLKHLRRVTGRVLARTYAPGTHENTFTDWVNHGKKLMLLCAGGTLYILPIIAALNLRTQITRQTAESDILSLASALRRVKHGMWLPMVRRLMMPIFHMRGATSGYIEALRLHRNKPLPVGDQSPCVESFAFRDIEESDRIFDSIETQFPKLHPRLSEWNSAAVPSWKPLEDPHRVKLSPVYSMETPLKLEKTKSPVNKRNRNTFTNTQRTKAAGAPVAKSLDDLQEHVCVSAAPFR
ncbi:hypothetical protein B0H14DRAFT_3745164, partial [Mycena olivaceomarginata]